MVFIMLFLFIPTCHGYSQICTVSNVTGYNQICMVSSVTGYIQICTVSSVTGKDEMKAVGDEVSFRPTNINPPVTSIIWKHRSSSGVVVKVIEWDDDGFAIPNQRFKGITTLDEKTGQITITKLTVEHSGVYTIDINSKEQEQRFSLEVIGFAAGRTNVTVRCPKPTSCNVDGFEKHWYKMDNYCVRYYNQPLNFSDAEFSCREKAPGAHLVSVHNKKHNEILLDIVKKFNPNNLRIWLGAFELFQSGKFLWLDGSFWDYEIWTTGEPTNIYNSKEECLEMNWKVML
ncbi:lectin-like protein [Labeo rohita]|uniref:Lectin-like protein n=1 Tax=Labeo rohita TaxID=84645 RepID=A0A498LJ52_LABRO|nr:lectin-like protein [Labeo rohita]